jgi:uncharacterized membrane protein
MDRIIVAVFDDEKRAYEGSRALRELHDEGSITLYADSVIGKDTSGYTSILRAADAGPAGTFLGALTGGLVGMLGGPIAAAVGASAGMTMGAVFDLNQLAIGSDLLAEVSQSLVPGKAAVVAHVEEEWQTPVDVRVDALGGRVVRRNVLDVEDAYLEKEIAGLQAELADLQAEHRQASAERKVKLQSRIAKTQEKLKQREKAFESRIEAIKQEGEAKVASLRQQAAKARADRKARLEQRREELRVEYRERSDKLRRAWELTKSALTV